MVSNKYMIEFGRMLISLFPNKQIICISNFEKAVWKLIFKES